ncbi:MAG: M56 family metallopeptidase [Pyrinomonadaceae bacterium]
MNWNALFTSELVADLGWTLFHSVWQFALTALCLAVALRLMRNARADTRYALAVFLLAISASLPVVTFVQYYGDTKAETHSSFISSKEKTTAGVTTRPQPEVFDESASASSTVSAENEFSLSSLMYKIERQLPSLFPVAFFGWIIGIAFFSLRITGGLWHLNRIRTVGVLQPDEDWTSRFRGICSRLDLGDGIRFICSDLVETPIAMGIVRPMIIVPASAFLHLSPQQLETIIAHELIHIRRFDPLVNAVQAAIETIFFYHPAIWWMSSRIRTEREFAADAGVLELFDSSQTLYASALADLEEIRLTANMTTPRFAAAANGGNLMQRIQKILQIKTEVSRASSAWTAGLALLLTSAVLLLALSFSSGSLVNANSNNGSKRLAIGFVSIPPLDRTTNPPKDADATMPPADRRSQTPQSTRDRLSAGRNGL